MHFSHPLNISPRRGIQRSRRSSRPAHQRGCLLLSRTTYWTPLSLPHPIAFTSKHAQWCGVGQRWFIDGRRYRACGSIQSFNASPALFMTISVDHLHTNSILKSHIRARTFNPGDSPGHSLNRRPTGFWFVTTNDQCYSTAQKLPGFRHRAMILCVKLVCSVSLVS